VRFLPGSRERDSFDEQMNVIRHEAVRKKRELFDARS
jgi:hypothetical protein